MGGKLRDGKVVISVPFCLEPVNLTGNATSCTKHPLFYVTKMVIT